MCDGGAFALRNFRLELGGDRPGDFALNGKEIRDIAIVGLRPEVGIGAGIDELRVDAQMIAGALHAAFEEMRHAEFLSDLPQVTRFGLVLAGRGAADHFEIGDPGQVGKNFILHASREVGVFLVGAQVFEREDGDAFPGRRGVRSRVSLPIKVKRQSQCQPRKNQRGGGSFPASQGRGGDRKVRVGAAIPFGGGTPLSAWTSSRAFR